MPNEMTLDQAKEIITQFRGNAVGERGALSDALDTILAALDAPADAVSGFVDCPECKSRLAVDWISRIEEEDSGGTRYLIGCPVCEKEWEAK